MYLNTHFQIDTIKQQNEQIQQSQLSTLATNVCKTRFPKDSNEDYFWITDKTLWQYFGTIISKARKSYVSIGALSRDLYKYASGKVIASRTNWKSFQMLETWKDKDAKLCAEANSLKRHMK